MRGKREEKEMTTTAKIAIYMKSNYISNTLNELLYGALQCNVSAGGYLRQLL